MVSVLEGIYHDGTIELKNKYPIKENVNLKIIIIEEDKKIKNIPEKKHVFGKYKLGNQIDKINLRNFAYED